MSFPRPLLALIGVGALGLATIGVGAGATFTDAVHGTQTITAGTISLSVQSASGTLSPDHKTVIMPAFGPVGSTFQTTNNVITITNTGNISAYESAFQLGVTTDGSAASTALRNEMNVCIKSTDPASQGGSTWVEANGPLMTGVNLVPSVQENPLELKPGETMTFSVDFYAGKDSTQCGTKVSDGSNTASRWGSYVTPPSLTSAAMGGVVTPTLAFSFTG